VKRALPLLLLVACAAQQISLRTGARSFTPEDYENVYTAWTRDQEDFEWARLEDVLRVSATFESWEFRWAYVVRYASDYSLAADAREAMLRATLDDARDNHRFFVTLTGNNYRESDLSSPRTAWRVLLLDSEGNQTDPVEIERIRRVGAADRTYFPSWNPHRQAFRIVFPARRDDGSPSIPEDAEHVVLRFTGAQGRVDLRWSFTEPGAAEE